MASTRNWSELYSDLLNQIATKIKCIEDFLAFSGVCVSWSTAATKENFKGTRRIAAVRAHNLHFNPFETDSDTGYSGKSMQLPFPKNIESYCLGWRGWILVCEKIGNVMYLWHIFTQTQIILPDKDSLDVNTMDCTGRRRGYLTVGKAVLSSNPLTTPSNYTLMVIFGNNSQIAFWRPGDQNFTKKMIYFNDDVMYHNGLFYSIQSWGSIKVFDIKGNLLTGSNYVGSMYRLQVPDNTGLYLVESAGELLLVERIMTSFRVFAFKLNEWKEVNDLGNRAIFVGLNTSFSVDASEIPGCKTNHAYFTDHHGLPAPKPQYYVGVYNLLDGRVEYSHCAVEQKRRRRYHLPLWLTPTFF